MLFENASAELALLLFTLLVPVGVMALALMACTRGFLAVDGAAARAADRLVRRGWARRLRSPQDKKAVYVALTDEGAFQADLIGATVNELARTRLWANLEPGQRDAIARVGHTVVADLRDRKAAREQAELDQLVPAE